MIVEDEEEGQAARPGSPYDAIHISHKRAMTHKIVFCRNCGYWMKNKSQKLLEVCPLAPANNDYKHKLRRMRDGWHPESKVKDKTATKKAVTFLDAA